MSSIMTPIMSSRSRSSSTSSLDEAYFFKTYVPLSNLPTPPPSSHSNSSLQQTPANFLSHGETLDPDLLGPATHLTNLVPSATSLTAASVPLVHAILTRSHLPIEIIALAVCILDSLSSRFALSWRQGCPLLTPHPPPLFGLSIEQEEVQHIDSIHPELIVLAALVLAVKFLDDGQKATKEYASDSGGGLWSCKQINFTERCILENLRYCLLSLTPFIPDALGDMERAGRYASPELRADEDWDTDTCFGSFGSHKDGQDELMSCRSAVLGMGNRPTPVDTPIVENSPITNDISRIGIGIETQIKQTEVDRAEPRSQQLEFPIRLRASLDGRPTIYHDPMDVVVGFDL